MYSIFIPPFIFDQPNRALRPAAASSSLGFLSSSFFLFSSCFSGAATGAAELSCFFSLSSSKPGTRAATASISAFAFARRSLILSFVGMAAFMLRAVASRYAFASSGLIVCSVGYASLTPNAIALRDAGSKHHRVIVLRYVQDVPSVHYSLLISCHKVHSNYHGEDLKLRKDLCQVI